ncbi:uncharacterized protein V2V93DRAFT_343809 [Kockiozyma suomiensis]|uniref:uncharacterized protein n=1 Tax=Kockiozyma suomiensis TaxID=1337062 RepID=UPI003343112E
MLLILPLLLPLLSFAAASGTYVGCFASAGSLSLDDTYGFQSSLNCIGVCEDDSNAVFALSQGSQCWCGSAIPGSQVDDASCDTVCDGYGLENCGGTGFYSVYLTGVGSVENPAAVQSAAEFSAAATSETASASETASSSTSSSTSTTSVAESTSSSSTTLVAESTSSASTTSSSSFTPTESASSDTAVTTATAVSSVVVAPSASASASTDSGADSSSSLDKSSGISGGAIGGIVAGVVVGLIAIAALFFFLWRRRRNSDDDDDDWPDYSPQSRSTRARGGAAPLASESPQTMPSEKLSSNSLNRQRVAIVDQRLNPVMMERRLSDGSLSDEQDYSRKILRVVNVD